MCENSIDSVSQNLKPTGYYDKAWLKWVEKWKYYLNVVKN